MNFIQTVFFTSTEHIAPPCSWLKIFIWKTTSFVWILSIGNEKLEEFSIEVTGLKQKREKKKKFNIKRVPAIRYSRYRSIFNKTPWCAIFQYRAPSLQWQRHLAVSDYPRIIFFHLIGFFLHFEYGVADYIISEILRNVFFLCTIDYSVMAINVSHWVFQSSKAWTICKHWGGSIFYEFNVEAYG